MPEISRFYGIVIGMFFDNHNPPHFHAKYAKHQAEICIKDLAVIQGYTPIITSYLDRLLLMT